MRTVQLKQEIAGSSFLFLQSTKVTINPALLMIKTAVFQRCSVLKKLHGFNGASRKGCNTDILTLITKEVQWRGNIICSAERTERSDQE
jgi:hypothetical protein